MTNEYVDGLWVERVERNGDWTLTALTRISGLLPAELRELVDYGALVPENPNVGSEDRWTFGGHCVVIVQTAVRLRRDFDLDAPGLALALTLIGRINDLEDELRKLQLTRPRDAG